MWLNTLKAERAGHWLDLVIFTSLDFREFVILGLFSMSFFNSRIIDFDEN